jgi:hypothetical protein
VRTIPAALGATLLAVASVMAQSPPVETGTPPPQVEKRFAPGGTIYMDLSAGGYVIEGTPDPGIRIRWTTRDTSDAGSVRATADVKGTHARITISGPKNGFSARVEVPVRSDVAVSLSAGDLVLGGLVGDKDVSAWAGKIDVTVPNRDEYYSVRASVTAGEIRAEPFQVHKGGVFRSFWWEGKGRHALRVRLTAGDVVLHAGPKVK